MLAMASYEREDWGEPVRFYILAFLEPQDH